MEVAVWVAVLESRKGRCNEADECENSKI